ALPLSYRGWPDQSNQSCARLSNRTASGGESQIRLPARVTALGAAHRPGATARWSRSESQLPVHLLRCAIALDVVAAQAARDEVLPRVRSSARARHHVIDRGGRLAAVAAAVIIAPQHTTPGQRHTTTHRHP